jgi:hypothetical protein
VYNRPEKIKKTPFGLTEMNKLPNVYVETCGSEILVIYAKYFNCLCFEGTSVFIPPPKDDQIWKLNTHL